MQRGLRIARDPVEDLLVGLDGRARRELAAVVGIERGLPEYRPRGSALVIFTEPRASEYIGPMCTW